MKLILQSFLYCYLLTTVAHCVELDISPKLRKRLSVWMERSESTAESEQFVRPEEVRDTLTPHSSNDISIRTKRSKNSVNQSRRQGCSLGTCTVHDLAHRLHVLNNKMKIGSAPIDKISPQGYGRRRRSLPGRRATLQLEQGRLRPVWSNTDSQVHRLETLLRRT